MAKQCYSDIECKIIKDQIERRAKYRQEFLKLRTDPCKHSQEAGYVPSNVGSTARSVFDPAIQRFISMKSTQLYYFKPGVGNVIGAIATVLPMIAYGYLLYKDRMKLDEDCRCGRLKYCDRLWRLK